jgi:undecaprenyl-diphosphatase
MFDVLYKIDITLLLFINGNNSSCLDAIMWFASGRFTWIPLYLVIIGFLIYKYRWRSIIILLLIGILILISDKVASGFFKPFFHRLRPSHEPSLTNLLHFVNEYKGGNYGFISSHACNVFSLAFFIKFILKKEYYYLILIIFSWAALVSYSRVYLGVHYPSDVLLPIFISMIVAYFISKLYFIIEQYLNRKIKMDREINA